MTARFIKIFILIVFCFLFFPLVRWRLQKAFYEKRHLGKCSCAGIGWYDFFAGSHLPRSCTSRVEPIYHAETNALTLADLQEVKPKYISNIVVDGWRVCKSEPNYGLLTMTPTEIERIQLCEQNNGGEPQNPFTGKLEPRDIKLSAAMAMSAAAVSPRKGAYEQTEQSSTHILTILGLEMGASMVYDLAYERNEHKCYKVNDYLNSFCTIGNHAYFSAMCYAELFLSTAGFSIHVLTLQYTLRM